ncbi:MAG: hypothetical protein ABII88_03485 [Candidatus Omnitrophota bacterium]
MGNKKINNNRITSVRGVSLTELLIVSVIFCFITAVLLTVLSVSKSAWYISDTRSDVYTNAKKAMSEMFMELLETSSGAVETFTFIDPIDGEYRECLWFASGRGSASAAGEDGSANNSYVHLDADNVVSWRALVVYAIYETPDGVQQLRRYVDHGSSTAYYSGGNIFPLTFLSATTTTLNFLEADGVTVISINRTGGRVLANYVETEDTNNNAVLDSNEDDGDISQPQDNADGVLNSGVNFTKNVGSVDITLFLRRETTALRGSGRVLTSTLRNTVKFRQP